MSTAHASHSETARATVQECFDAITEFESYAEWASGVKTCRVLERDDQGRGSLIEMVLDLRLRTIRYVLRYGYDEPAHLWWKSVDGDVKLIDGDYRFEDQGDGTTRMTYSVEVDPGMFVPGPVKSMLAGATVKNAVRDLKRRVESR